MYAPSELLEQIKRDVTSEFKHIITSFEWFHEEEYTGIYIEIRQIAWYERVDDYTDQLVNSILGDQYIVSVLVRAIESIDQPDGLFNLTYSGASNTFFVDYYAPEYARLSCPSGKNRLRASIYYTRMIKGMRRIYLDSPSELWAQLFRPIQETFAKQKGVHSFCKELAPDLRDFLLEHLDFIERMIEASGETLEVLPAPVTLLSPSSLANGRKPSLARKDARAAQQELALPTAVAA